MTRRYLGLLVILLTVLCLTSSSSGQSKPRKTRTSSTSIKQPNGVAKVGLNETSTTKPKTEAPFTGGSEDGQSIRRKQSPSRDKSLEGDPDQPIVVGSARAKQAKAAQINADSTVTPPTVTSKKPDHFSGGTDDGQSIRRKQRGNLQNKQSSETQEMSQMNMQIKDGTVKPQQEKSAAQAGPGVSNGKQKQPHRRH